MGDDGRAAPKHPLHLWAHRDRRKIKWVIGKIGVSWPTLSSWAHRKTCPCPRSMKAIEIVTGGAVTPTDCVNYFLGETHE